MTVPALQITGLCKSFGRTSIIRDLGLSVERGERHGVIGPNGAGKSTLFHLISGRYAPSSGTILMGGQPIQGRPAHVINRMGMARSFQISTVFSSLSVFENLRIATMARHGSRFGLFTMAGRARRINEDADGLIDLLGLRGVRDVEASALTYSHQRALEIGMALGTGGDLVLLDEPTAGMSSDDSRRTAELIRRVTAGKTLLVVEHDMEVVFSLCDRISVLVYGQIIATGSPEAIREDARVQEAYLGHHALAHGADAPAEVAHA